MQTLQPKVLVKSHCQLGEGPVWDSETEKLYFLDIKGKQLHVLKWGEYESKVARLPQQTGCIALCDDGSLIGAMMDGVYSIKKRYPMVHMPVDILGERFNDGKAGPDGRFYVGTIKRDGGGCLYRMENGRLHTVLNDVRISNGMDWSLDHRHMYYCDSATNGVDRFEFDNGRLKNRKTIICFEPELNMGRPDGLCIDREGKLWIALWGGGKVVRVDPNTGDVISHIIVPVERVSSCTFAGPELDTLVITTAMKDEDGQIEELAGHVFAVRLAVGGRAPFRVEKSNCIDAAVRCT